MSARKDGTRTDAGPGVTEARAGAEGNEERAQAGPTLARALAGLRRGWIASLAASTLMLAGGVAAQDVKGDPEAGGKKNGMCIGCHAIEGYRASYPVVYSVPKINGQTQRYIELALMAYRNGDRDHPTMRAIAGSLTDQDIADLAAY